MKEKLLCISALCILAAAGYRLPRTVLPENYKLQILTYLGEKDNFDFDGRVWIQTQCVEVTGNITLHVKDLEIKTQDITLKDISSAGSKPLKDLKISFDKDNDFMIIDLDKPLRKDHKYEIFVEFRGKLDDGLAGFYRSSYYDKKKKEKVWLGVTQFEAISARRAFPCFDEPEMKATFDISIGRKEGYNAISNMPLLTTEPMEGKDGYYWDRFDSSVPMSTYLVAYVVSDFGERTAPPSNENNVTFRIWARKDALNQVEFAKEVGPKALEYYEKFFDIEYPLPKQDMIALPDFNAGAMENWGLVTYREAYLLYDPEVSSKTSQHSVASVIAHELAHQWFGNLVTMKWWTDLWLNEGFATYMASLCVEHIFPQWNSLQEEAASDMLSVFSFDSLRSSHPVSVPIGDPKEIDEIFDTISYKKGSSLIRMMSLFLGEKILSKGVSNYLNRHKFGNAEQDDLWEALTEEAHNQNVLPKNLTVKLIMDTWTLQTGYPVIKVVRDYEKGYAEISQSRYLRDVIKPKDGDEDPCWWVPLSYSTEKDVDFDTTTPKHWLSCPKTNTILEKIAEPSDWVIFNNQLAGIYKVNYDDKNWKLIYEALMKDHERIPVLNRVQLLSDSADLAFIGDLSYDVFFNLIKYLKGEDEYLPWKTALGKTGGIKTYLQNTPYYGDFKEFMKRMLTPIYQKIGGFQVAESKSDKLDSVKQQVLITSQACKFEVSNCIAQAKHLFEQWRSSTDGKNPISKDMRSVVYCTSLKHGGEKEWNFLWNQYKNSNVATEKTTMLNALGCTRELWLLRRYLEWTLTDDNSIRRQDATSVFATVARNDVGFFIAKDFLLNNIKGIAKRLAPNRLGRIGRFLSPMASHMSTEKEFDEMKKFIESHKEEFSGAKKAVEQTLETITINIQWQDRHRDEIRDILKKFIEEED